LLRGVIFFDIYKLIQPNNTYNISQQGFDFQNLNVCFITDSSEQFTFTDPTRGRFYIPGLGMK
jgi:hypothetical protein